MTHTTHLTLRRRIHRRFFYSRVASICTIFFGFVLAIIALQIFQWAFLHAVWRPNVQACHQAKGACWGFVAEKWRLILFGRFPYEEQWRASVAMLVLAIGTIVSCFPSMWKEGKRKVLASMWGVVLFVFFGLMYGGIFQLPVVTSDLWGGLPLTLLITIVAMVGSVPLGILLALGRRSSVPLIKTLSVLYIELVRGVPLISVLFLATFIFPLLMPNGLTVDVLWRVCIAVVLFQAAYIAETVRGGLQTIPQGQYYAAMSLGLSKYKTYRYIVLPQALVAVIPAFVNSLLSCFMDTSLVIVVSMYDLTGSLRLALGDAVWRTFFVEGYCFIAFIYFSVSVVISRYSKWLEVYLHKKKSYHK